MPRMEDVYTQIESLNILYQKTKLSPGPKVKRYRKQLESFVQDTASFFSRIFTRDKIHLNCTYHERLAMSLESGDGVISFNYDCLMDSALAKAGSSDWNPRNGYGVSVIGDTKQWQCHGSQKRCRKEKSIRLLKLHGSLNWDRSASGSGIKLREEPYDSNNRHETEIVTPVWNKRVLADGNHEDLELTKVWKDARRILSEGRMLIAVGYSVPPTDLLSHALIRVTASERNRNQRISNVIVANPDRASRLRFIDLVRDGVDTKTKILELESLEELHTLLEEPQATNTKRTSGDAS